MSVLLAKVCEGCGAEFEKPLSGNLSDADFATRRFCSRHCAAEHRGLVVDRLAIPDTAETELAWAAGFFDGEGGTYSHVNRSRDSIGIQMAVTQKDRAQLDRFREAVGVGKVYEDAERDRGRCCRWTVSGFWNIGSVALALWPYLGEAKREQTLRALTRYFDWKLSVGGWG